MGLAEKSWTDVWGLKAPSDVGGARDEPATTALFQEAPAQSEIRLAFQDAGYIVVDRRARRQWSPQTLQYIEQDGVPVFTADDVILLAKRNGVSR
jgi:hypothetical protein